MLRAVGQVRPVAPRLGDELLEQVVGPFGPLERENALERVDPFRGFEGVGVELAVHEVGYFTRKFAKTVWLSRIGTHFARAKHFPPLFEACVKGCGPPATDS